MRRPQWNGCRGRQFIDGRLEICRHCRRLLRPGCVVFAQKLGACLFEFLWSAVARAAGFGENLFRWLPGIEIPLALRRASINREGEPDDPWYNSTNAAHVNSPSP